MSNDLKERLREPCFERGLDEQWIDAQRKEAAECIEQLEAKLAKAMGALRECEAEIDAYIRHEYPGDHPVQARYRKRDFDANPARIAIAEIPAYTGCGYRINEARQRED